jgi:hypothetical protein
MKVVCRNDKGRPDEIPTSKWVKEGDEYTVIDAIPCNMQPGAPIALVLEEIDLSGHGFYKGFCSSRFEIVQLGPPEIAEYNLCTV